MKHGFTLVEILVSIAVLSIGILAVSQMTVMGMKTNVTIRETMTARNALAQGLEALKLADPKDPYLYDNCDGDSTLLDSLTNAYQAHTGNAVGQMIGQTNYDVYWNVLDDFPQQRLKTIRMIVCKGEKRLIQADFVKQDM